MRRFVVTAAVLALTVVPGAVGADEDGDGATAVTASAQDVAAGAPLPVSGEVTFGPDVFDDVFAQEGSGGQIVPAQFGTDIVGATITSDPARPGHLTFAVQLSELPPGIGGTPEVVIYNWALRVNGQTLGGDDSYLEWRRTNVSGGRVAATPSIMIRTCQDNTCSGGMQQEGGFHPDDDEIRATIPVGRRGLEADPGDRVDAGLISIYHGTGVLWLPGSTSDTAFVDDDYIIPGRDGSVRLGIVPRGADAPSDLPVAVTPGGSGAEGAFNATLSTAGLAPGDYDVVTRACWGANCGENRTPVTLH